MEITFNDKTIKYRKWKVKDRNAFVNAQNKIDKRQALVYNCLDEPNTPLDNEEYNYMLLKIRSESLSPLITYTLKCPKCGKIHSANINLNDFLSKVNNTDYSNIIVNNINNTTIELQPIKNKNSYETALTQTDDPYEKYILDFAFHVKTINNNSALTFDAVKKFIYDLDVDDFEQIFSAWESQRFKINMTGYIECPYCLENTLYNFDDLPDFFPRSWKLK